MRVKAKRARTAPLNAPKPKSKTEFFLNTVLTLINALIFLGGLIWWVPKQIITFTKLASKGIKKQQEKIREFKTETFRKLESQKTSFRQLLKSLKPQLKLKPFLKFFLSGKNVLINKLEEIRTSFKKKTFTAKGVVKVKKKGQIYPAKPLFLERLKFLSLGILLTLFAIVGPLIFSFWLNELPNPRLLSAREIPLSTKIYDRNGILLFQIYASQNRSFIKLDDLPKNLVNATVAIEDKNFFHHPGVDLRGILRAFLINLALGSKTNGRPLQGGSTITQQLIKNALLSSELTWSRKIKEVVLAIWAETIYRKRDILEMYFNQVPYGGTAWGVEAAAETYFKKKVKDLDLAESALLAGLPAAPSYYSPFGAHPELARERQHEVLRRMTEDKYITSQEANETEKEELHYATQAIEIKAPHFVMYVKDLLVKKYGLRTVEQGGLNVTTSLDLNTQDMVQDEVAKEVENLKNLLVSNGSAVVTNPKTGEILAMVGSRDYFDLAHDGNVNVTLALRQPGSSIKPVMYSAALQHGFTPSSIIDDSAISFRIPGQPPYAPVNYDGKFHGKVTLRSALANSFNVPAVKVLNAIGVHTMVDMGRKMGISTWEDESRFGLSLTLGGGEVTMLDMAKAYGVLANEGKKQELTPILKITDYQGNVLEQAKNKSGSQVLPTEIAFQLANILADNNSRSVAFGFNSALNIPGKTVSVKTGTTNDKRDNWTIGFTPSFVVVVWVGNNDNSPMHPYLTSGITGAAPIWHNIMVNLLKNKPNETIGKSEDIIEVNVCAWNGFLPCDGCPTITEYFARGTEPKIHCQITPSPSPTPEVNL
ncbi:penicillin-binding protein [Candidatus Gottesmanbacteria bacterium]|nr:penicillin-binding protein [Candidatus Gottesmanbacteria bacterium]